MEAMWRHTGYLWGTSNITPAMFQQFSNEEGGEDGHCEWVGKEFEWQLEIFETVALEKCQIFFR